MNCTRLHRRTSLDSAFTSSEESSEPLYPSFKRVSYGETLQNVLAACNFESLGNDGSIFIESTDISPCWPNHRNTHVYNVLVDFITSEYLKQGFCEAVTPNMYADSLWEPDGRWKHYLDRINKLGNHRKEMLNSSCSGHCLLYGHQIPSYAELPIKLADFSVLHRLEGTCSPVPLPFLHRFAMDDSHVFCRLDQVAQEIKNCLDFMVYFYGEIMKLNLEVHVATKFTDSAVTEDNVWNVSQEALVTSSRNSLSVVTVKENAAPYYGPRADIIMRDHRGRYHLFARIQLDFELPERFNLCFTSEDGREQRPILIHRSVTGAVETLMAITDSECFGFWPFWLSPNQVVVMPVSLASVPYARKIQQQLVEEKFQVQADLSCMGCLNRRIKNTVVTKCNFILVVGKNEAANGTVNVRTRNDMVLGEFLIEDVIKLFRAFMQEHTNDAQCADAFANLRVTRTEKRLHS